MNLKFIDSIYLIRKYMAKDHLYKDIFGLESLKDWIPDTFKYRFFVVMEDDKQLGLFIIEQPFNNCVCFHGGIYEEHRHKNSIEITKEVLKIIKKDLHFVLITTVRESNINALKFVRKLNFKERVTIKNGYSNDNMVLFTEN